MGFIARIWEIYSVAAAILFFYGLKVVLDTFHESVPG